MSVKTMVRNMQHGDTKEECPKCARLEEEIKAYREALAYRPEGYERVRRAAAVLAKYPKVKK